MALRPFHEPEAYEGACDHCKIVAGDVLLHSAPVEMDVGEPESASGAEKSRDGVFSCLYPEKRSRFLSALPLRKRRFP
jgi:hypothetical protein